MTRHKDNITEIPKSSGPKYTRYFFAMRDGVIEEKLGDPLLHLEGAYNILELNEGEADRLIAEFHDFSKYYNRIISSVIKDHFIEISFDTNKGDPNAYYGVIIGQRTKFPEFLKGIEYNISTLGQRSFVSREDDVTLLGYFRTKRNIEELIERRADTSINIIPYRIPKIIQDNIFSRGYYSDIAEVSRIVEFKEGNESQRDGKWIARFYSKIFNEGDLVKELLVKNFSSNNYGLEFVLK